MVTIEKLRKIKQELERFELRLDAAIKKLEKDKYAYQGCKETGAVKRSALDLKAELTKITQ